jgi:DNA-binding CsgD family transcriptional regulator
MKWAMKTERDVIQLARGNHSAKQIAAKLKIDPEAVIKAGRRLGIYLPSLEHKRNGRRRTK